MAQTDTIQQIVLTQDQFEALMARAGATASKDDQLELMREQARLNAEENRKQLKPENATHPGVSVFVRPGGEQKNPKGALRCPMNWAGWPVDVDTITADEFDLLNQIQPGEYRCNRPDGTMFVVAVLATRNAMTGKLDRIDVNFATKGKLKDGLPSMVAMCRELIAQAASPVKVA